MTLRLPVRAAARVGLLLVVALALGLLADAWRDERVFFGRRAPVLRSVPAP